MRRPAGKYEVVLLVLNKMPLCWSVLFLPPCRDGYSVGCNGRTSRSGRLSSMGSPALEEDGIFLNSNNSKLLERAQGILMWVTYHKVTVVFFFCLFVFDSSQSNISRWALEALLPCKHAFSHAHAIIQCFVLCTSISFIYHPHTHTIHQEQFKTIDLPISRQSTLLPEPRPPLLV